MKDLLMVLLMTIIVFTVVSALILGFSSILGQQACLSYAEVNRNPKVSYEWRLFGGCIMILPDGTSVPVGKVHLLREE